LLSKGLKFVPTPRNVPPEELKASIQIFLDDLYQETSFTGEFRRLQSGLNNLVLPQLDIPIGHNLTVDERDALADLRSNSKIKILPADKNLGTVVCDSSWFRKECLRQLDDVKTYQRSNKTLQDLQQDISTSVSFMDLPPSLKDRMLAGLDITSFPKFYILPKVHKTPILGRPIVGAHSAPTTRVSKWVDSQLKLYLPMIPTYVKGSLDVLQRIQEFVIPPRLNPRRFNSSIDPIDHLPSGLCLFAADVVSLYPSIPQRLGVQAVKEFLRPQSFNPIPTLRMTEERQSVVVALLELVLTKNFFIFEDEVFHQLEGTAMGTNLAPSFATIFLHQLENGFFSKYRRIFPFVVRFIDDYFGVSLTTPEETKRLLTKELAQPASGFSLTVETGLSVPFLDLQISISGDRFETNLFQKAMNLFLYTPYTSFQPRSVKIALIKGEVVRYIRSCSKEEDFLKIMESFSARLQARGYPLNFIQKVLSTAHKYSDRTSLLSKVASIDSSIVPLVLRYAPNTAVVRQLFPELPSFVKLVYRKNKSLLDYLRTPVRPPDDESNLSSAHSA